MVEGCACAPAASIQTSETSGKIAMQPKTGSRLFIEVDCRSGASMRVVSPDTGTCVTSLFAQPAASALQVRFVRYLVTKIGSENFAGSIATFGW